MAWSGTSPAGRQSDKYTVWQETVTTKQESITYSSEIDFIPPGHDFQVIVNTGATNLSSSTHAEMYVAYADGAAAASRYRRNVAGFNSTTAAVDNTTAGPLFWDISSHGQYPYYYIRFGENDSADAGGGEVNIAIIIGEDVRA